MFSGRLGQEPRVERANSVESIQTQLSLLTCSMKNDEIKKEIKEHKKRKRQRKKTCEPEPVSKESKWIQFANQRKGFLDRMMVTQNAQATANFNMNQEHVYQVRGTGSAYDLMDEDERTMLYRCAFSTGIKMPRRGLTKSGSTRDLTSTVVDRKRKILSAGEKRSEDKDLIDFPLCKVQLANRRSGSESRLGEDASPCRLLDELPTLKPASAKQVRIWQKEVPILADDVKQEFSSKVNDRVRLTTRALRRVTGLGESNRPKRFTGSLPEFPKYNAADYCRIPKIQQRIRISPQLSHVIGEDIKERMGRPRYHEISARDLVIWNKGSKLDRTHRNLKVFNWLNSLKEDEFEMDIEPEIHDEPPSPDYVFPSGALHIEACDDLDQKPLYARANLKFIERVQRSATTV